MKYLEYFEGFNTGDMFDGFLIEGKGIPNTVKNVVKVILKGNTRFAIDEIDLKVDLFKINLNFTKNDNHKPYGNINVDTQNNIIVSATLDVIIRQSDLLTSEFKRLLTHEVLHLYEIYQRTKNYKPEKNGLEWNVSHVLQKIKNKYITRSEEIFNFCKILYLAFDHEINARVAETYTVLIETRNNDKDDLYEVLTQSNAWNCAEKIENYKPDLLPTDYPIFIEFFNELNSNTGNIKDFVIYQQVINNTDVDKILNEYVKMFKKKSEKFKSKMIRVIDEVIKDVDMISKKYK